MAAAGCPVSKSLPPAEAGGAQQPSTLDKWLGCLERLGAQYPAWAAQRGMAGITAALLQCGAAEQDERRPRLLTAAMATGSRALYLGVRSALLSPGRNDAGVGLVLLAARELGTALGALPPPPKVSSAQPSAALPARPMHAGLLLLGSAPSLCTPAQLMLRASWPAGCRR